MSSGATKKEVPAYGPRCYRFVSFCRCPSFVAYLNKPFSAKNARVVIIMLMAMLLRAANLVIVTLKVQGIIILVRKLASVNVVPVSGLNHHY